MQLNTDTIAAISTPPGRGAIGIVRLSGPDACVIPNLTRPPTSPRQARLTRVLDEHEIPLDQVVATYYQAPHSYTGEDVLELACHGAPVLLEAILRACLARGARLAEPGEFTQRALLNHRLDLAQAEAVRDLIDAQTIEQAQIAQRQLAGSLSLALAPGKQGLLALIAQLEAGIDFVEDDLDLLPQAAILAELEALTPPLRALAASYAYGRRLRHGFTLALVGPPNAGKSSLFNALLGRDRAIVTPEPGTTRDTLTEHTAIAGIPVTLIDTAGLRANPASDAEALGIARTRQAIAEADLVLLITAGPVPHSSQPHRDEWEFNGDAVLPNEEWDPATIANAIQIRSKADLTPTSTTPGHPTSAHTGQGIAELRDLIAQHLGATETPGELITSLRQHTSLTEALAALERAANAAAQHLPHEMLLLDLYTALAALDGLTGATASDEVLHRIFASFCIGK